jgi:hypothetical protein
VVGLGEQTCRVCGYYVPDEVLNHLRKFQRRGIDWRKEGIKNLEEYNMQTKVIDYEKQGYTKAEAQPFHNFEEEGNLEGEYIGSKVIAGNYGPQTVYLIKKADGHIVICPGGAVMSSVIADVPLGSKVAIVSLGKETGKSGRDYNNYDVYVKPK